jgi:hypothetical protein
MATIPFMVQKPKSSNIPSAGLKIVSSTLPRLTSEQIDNLYKGGSLELGL